MLLIKSLHLGCADTRLEVGFTNFGRVSWFRIMLLEAYAVFQVFVESVALLTQRQIVAIGHARIFGRYSVSVSNPL